MKGFRGFFEVVSAQTKQSVKQLTSSHLSVATDCLVQVIKYGVTRKEALCRDLEHWDTLYVAGRLQKPVLTLEEDAAISRANQKNQMAALGASLLLLPQAFTTQVRVLGLGWTQCAH